MTLREAAIRVLKETGTPMHSGEIVTYAEERKWITLKGKTPDHTLQSIVWRDIQKNGSKSVFIVLGRKAQIRRRYFLRELR
jgi:hypothetical protein